MSTFHNDEVRGIVVQAGGGADRITLGTDIGSARVEADSGDDVIDASATALATSSITLLGGSGNDRLISGLGHDLLSGDDGLDTLLGSSTDDRLVD